MYLFTVVLHIVLCVFLVLIIILQPGKGGDVGAAFGGGGGGSTMFGPRGPTSLLQRATTFVAVAFMGTSLTLAIYSNKSILADSQVDDELRRLAEEEAAAEQVEEVELDLLDEPLVAPPAE